MGTCPLILDRLTWELDAQQLLQCVPLVGKETTLSQHYPDEMVKQILIGIKQTALQLDPWRFAKPLQSQQQVFAVTIESDDWKPVFESAKQPDNEAMFWQRQILFGGWCNAW